MGTELTARLIHLAIEHGQYSDSFLTTEPDREYFWSHDYSGVIGFLRSGRHFKVVGGVLAPASHRATLLRQFMEFARSCGGTVAFLDVGDDHVPLLQAEHFRITKWGEEAILDLPERTWRGKQFERVRQQLNYGQRHGLKASEVTAGPAADAETSRLHKELRQVSALCVQGKPQAAETSMMQARLRPERATGQRIFVARNQDGTGRVEAFVVCLPGKGGTLWSAEIYRHRPDGVRNAVVFLIHQVAQVLRSEGAQHLSLGLVPGLRCQQPRPGDSALTRRALQLSWHCLGFVFDLKGVHAFKERFRPRYEPRYCCVWPARGLSIGSTLAFIRLWGVLDLNPIRTAKTLARQALVVRGRRKTLATHADR
jgi:phosphatidylglycerol lysyltransferase